MRLLIATGLVLTLATSTAIGQTGSGSDSGARLQPRTPSTLRYLNQRIDEVTFEEAPLDQVIDWIGGLTPMQIRPRWQVLEDAGVERDKPITMDVSNLRLSQVLWIIMEEAGGPDLKLAYRASGELLILSTAEDLGKELHLKVYDVSDLLIRPPRFTNAPHLDLAGQGGGGGMMGGGGGGQNIFGGQGGTSGRDEDDDRDREEGSEMEKLIALIQATVEPDSWQINGGLGTIDYTGNLLVVYNNFLVHQRLGGYVEEVD